ncbi:endonuclease III [Desulfurispira natronophila]|uniref:Endonuclease III n=1 Tax=Desulfurispira natronophila TaxID=682562 RepID=A0A7W7Y291_9BACT|nr:endonuclease III [Desulfurispira natronophila]MBB5020738.1 endonuclease-3 [Desulfurispira natronophila]
MPVILSGDRVRQVVATLEDTYPDAAPELDFSNPFELVIAVMLSAQCTDVRVNLVTHELFARYPDAQSLASANIEDVESIIRTCGLYRNKSRNAIAASQMIVDRFCGEVPASREELQQLPGIGRKSANVILSCAMSQDAIAVDTHVYRVSRRIGLSDASTVLGVEKDLMDATPRKKWSQLHHLLIFHGRRCCKAHKPQCQTCTVAHLCGYNASRNKSSSAR